MLLLVVGHATQPKTDCGDGACPSHSLFLAWVKPSDEGSSHWVTEQLSGGLAKCGWMSVAGHHSCRLVSLVVPNAPEASIPFPNPEESDAGASLAVPCEHMNHKWECAKTQLGNRQARIKILSTLCGTQHTVLFDAEFTEHD